MLFIFIFFFAFSRVVIGVIVFRSQMFFVCASELLSRILKPDHLFQVPESTAYPDCSMVFLDYNLVSPQVMRYLQDSLKFNFFFKVNYWHLIFGEPQSESCSGNIKYVCLIWHDGLYMSAFSLPSIKYILSLKRTSWKCLIGVSWIACFFKFSRRELEIFGCFFPHYLKMEEGVLQFLLYFFFLIKNEGTYKSFTSLLFFFLMWVDFFFRFLHPDENKSRFCFSWKAKCFGKCFPSPERWALRMLTPILELQCRNNSLAL